MMVPVDLEAAASQNTGFPMHVSRVGSGKRRYLNAPRRGGPPASMRTSSYSCALQPPPQVAAQREGAGLGFGATV
jgi:hypothetical protein